jgi:hypothetical protein
MKNKIPQYYPLVFFALIVCLQTGCKTTGVSETNQNEANIMTATNDQITDTEMNQVEKGIDYIVTKSEVVKTKIEEKTGLDEDEIRRVKKILKEGWDIDIFGFFKVNASSDGLFYEKKFLKEKNGTIKIGADDFKPDKFGFNLAIVF